MQHYHYCYQNSNNSFVPATVFQCGFMIARAAATITILLLAIIVIIGPSPPFATAATSPTAAATAAFAVRGSVVQQMSCSDWTMLLQKQQQRHQRQQRQTRMPTIRRHDAPAGIIGTTTTSLCMSQASSSGGPSTATTAAVTTQQQQQQQRKRRPPPRPVFLTHERDFFRQQSRLNSMDSYVLVSTLTASMSFGCLVGFNPHPAAEVAMAITKMLGSSIGSAATSATAATTIMTTVQWLYKALCLAIQMVSGLSALCGLYATIIFSLTLLYSKSALGAERDREYEIFLRRTVRARVHGARCFSWSLGLFAVEALLVLMERTSRYVVVSLPIGCVGAIILYHLYRDWKLLFDSTEVIYKD